MPLQTAWCFVVENRVQVVLRVTERGSKYELPLTPYGQVGPRFLPCDPGFVVVRNVPVESGAIHNAIIAIVEPQALSCLPTRFVVCGRAKLKPPKENLMHHLLLEVEVDGSPYCGVASARSVAPYLTIEGVQALMKFAQSKLSDVVSFKSVRARKLGYVLKAYAIQRKSHRTVAFVKASPRRDVDQKTDCCQSLATVGPEGEQYVEHGKGFANEPWLSYAAAGHEVSPQVIAHDPCCGITVLAAAGNPCGDKPVQLKTVRVFFERYRKMQSKIAADTDGQTQVRLMCALQERELMQAVREELAGLPPDTETKAFSRFKTGFDLARAESLLKELAGESSVLETLCHGDMTSSNVVYSERSGLRCIDWSDAFFGRPYLESLPLSRVIRVRGKQTKSEEAVMRVFHETAVNLLQSSDFAEHFDKARPLRYLRRFVMAMRGLRIDPHSADAGNLTEDVWEFLVKADKCLRYPQSCVDEEGNLEDVDSNDLRTDPSSDEAGPAGGGDGVADAVAAEGGDEGGERGDQDNDSGAKGARSKGDKETDTEDDYNDDDGGGGGDGAADAEDVDPDTLETDRSSDDAGRAGGGDGAADAVAAEGGDEGGERGDQDNDSGAKGARSKETDTEDDDNEDDDNDYDVGGRGGGGAKASKNDVARAGGGRRKLDNDDDADAGANAAVDTAVAGNAKGNAAEVVGADEDYEGEHLIGDRRDATAAGKVTGDVRIPEAVAGTSATGVAPAGGNGDSDREKPTEDDDDDSDDPENVVSTGAAGDAPGRNDGSSRAEAKEVRSREGARKSGVSEPSRISRRANLSALFSNSMSKPSVLAIDPGKRQTYITPGRRQAPPTQARQSNSGDVDAGADDSNEDSDESAAKQRPNKRLRRP
jgi:hypothetical protein